MMMVVVQGGAGRGSRDRAQQWVFQGKVQGSVIFRQYYPEGGWGCVIVMVGGSITLELQTKRLLALLHSRHYAKQSLTHGSTLN